MVLYIKWWKGPGVKTLAEKYSCEMSNPHVLCSHKLLLKEYNFCHGAAVTGCGGSRLRRSVQAPFSRAQTPAHSGRCPDVPKPAGRYNPSRVPWIFRMLILDRVIQGPRGYVGQHWKQGREQPGWPISPS